MHWKMIVQFKFFPSNFKFISMFNCIYSPSRSNVESSDIFTTTSLYKERFPKVCLYFTFANSSIAFIENLLLIMSSTVSWQLKKGIALF